MIPDEAVEAAAGAMYAQDGGVGEFSLWVYQDYAKAMLEAAAPHMLDDARRKSYEAGRDQALAGVGPIYKAEGWDEGYAAGVREEQPGWTKNPYRSQE